jgi:adenylosuccinate lyase
MRSFEEGRDFKGLLLADPEITAVLGAAEIDRAFDLEEQFRHVDHIFARVFGQPGGTTIAESVGSLEVPQALR